MRVIRDCSVAVPGGAGFLGSHVVNHLIDDRNCDVVVIDNLVVGRREFIHPKARFEHADITLSERHLYDIFRRHGVRFVLNYIAWPYIPDSFARPLHVFNVNATGALHVINAAQEAGCEGILQVSSAEIYGEGSGINNVPGGNVECATELSRVIPHSSYGAAKAAIDAMVQVRWREAKTPCIALRQFNCVGERDVLHPYVIPEIWRQLASVKEWEVTNEFSATGFGAGQVKLKSTSAVPVVRLGNNSFRDFLYAGDQARMAVELLEKGQFGEVYNLGSETGIKIYDLAKLIGRLMGFDRVNIDTDPARVRPWEIWSLLADNSKIHGVIDYRPQVNLEEALRRTFRSFDGEKWTW